MPERKYSVLSDVDISNIKDFKTYSIEWAMRTRIIRKDGSSEVYILNEEDTDTLVANLYNMYPGWMTGVMPQEKRKEILCQSCNKSVLRPVYAARDEEDTTMVPRHKKCLDGEIKYWNERNP